MTTRRHISTAERGRIFMARGGVCHLCGGKIQATEAWDVSHDIPLAMGGDDDGDNLMVAHRKCHRSHTSATDIPQIAKAKRRHARHIGAKAPSRNPLPGGKNSRWKIKMDGSVVERTR